MQHTSHQLSIQYLRAVAALMVVVFHCFYAVPFMRPYMGGLGWLRAGVDIFFVISGYVMVISTAGRNLSPWEFAKRRIYRIVPIYWIVTAMMVLVGQSRDWWHTLASFLFLPAINPVNGYYEPLVQPGWTLNFEMFFYVLFAITLLLRKNQRLWTMALVLVGLIVIGATFKPTGIMGRYSNSILAEFLFGMLIAYSRPGWRWVFLPIGIFAWAMADYIIDYRGLLYGLPAAAVVAGVVILEDRLPNWRWLAFLGDASYSIYIFHMMMLGGFIGIWKSLEIDNIWFVPAAILFMIPIGLCVHQFLEKPITRLLNGKHKAPTREHTVLIEQTSKAF